MHPVFSRARFQFYSLEHLEYIFQSPWRSNRVSCEGGQTNICHYVVVPMRPHSVRHATARLQIYRATFGCVRAVCVDKAGHNVCHPITTEIYLPDRHILLQGPVCRLNASRRQRQQGRTEAGQRFKLLIITNLTQWTVKAWHKCPHQPLCFSIHCCPVMHKPLTSEM